jgi:predicted NAD/FAD-dependent oxidoreductase
VLAVLAGDSRIPPPGGQWMPGEPIAWIADNRRKGVSPAVTTVTLHAGPKFSRENYALGDEETAAQLISAAGDRLGSTVVKAYVHRWKFSLPTVTHPDRCLTVAGPPPVVFAGDAFGGPRVEGAALSGLAAAEAVADTLNRAGQVK